MQPGDLFHAGRPRLPGRFLRRAPRAERLFLIVSCAEFNQLTDVPVVWAVPVDGDTCDPAGLTHVDRRALTTPAGTCDAETLARTLRFIHWAFTGGGPLRDNTVQQDHAHAAAARSPEPEQGDVVFDADGTMMAVISGRGFNTTPDNDVRWTVRTEESGVVHPHLVYSRSVDELHSSPLSISAGAVRRNLDTILHKILRVT